ncbi:MAG: hypothetical protein Q7U05_09320 [Polaromonas sp.]|nr:hypothetical protein [Polaromonas sp.]
MSDQAINNGLKLSVFIGYKFIFCNFFNILYWCRAGVYFLCADEWGRPMCWLRLARLEVIQISNSAASKLVLGGSGAIIAAMFHDGEILGKQS